MIVGFLLVGCAEPPSGHRAASPIERPAPSKPTGVKVDECGPEIPGFDAVARAPVVMLGEVHGQVGSPAFAVDLACRMALHSGGAVLALEIPREEQERIDAYLASDGAQAARAAFLDGGFWKREFQDGRSSAAMLAAIEKSRQLRRAGLPLHIAAVDDNSAKGQAPREKAMADGLLALVQSKRGPTVVLIGNYHAHTVPGAPWDPKLSFTGVFVKEQVPATVSLDIRYGPGDGWSCQSAEATECGRKPTKGNGAGTPWAIQLFAAPNETGTSGTFCVGPAKASEPARELSPAMQAAVVANEFRAANRPRMVDGAPSESFLTPSERSEWCRRIIPVARERLALSGDKIAESDPCAVTLVADGSRQVVPDVQLRLDVGFFFAKPYAAASYDRESQTLFLPLGALSRPWDAINATRHEWLHAKYHTLARRGDPRAMALQTIVTGTDYRPDGFYVDEVLVNLCDVAQVARRGQDPWPPTLEMIEQHVRILRKELDAMKSLRKKSAQKRAGVPGVILRSSDSVDRWLGGPDPKRSLTILEDVWKDASAALARLRASPPDLSGALESPLFAGDACEPTFKR